jgi:hypothetical protein
MLQLALRGWHCVNVACHEHGTTLGGFLPVMGPPGPARGVSHGLDAPHALGVFAGTQLLGVVPPTFHSDVAAVLDTGLEVNPSLQPDGDGGLLLHLILEV